MTIQDAVRLLRANALLLLVAMTLGVLAMFVYTLRQPVVYVADTSGLVKVAGATSAGEEMSNLSLASQKATAYAELVSTVPVAERVAKDLKLDVPAESIVGRFSAYATGGQTLVISATGATPEEARDLGNAVIDALAEEAAALENIGRPEGAPPLNLVQIIPMEEAGLPGSPASPNYQKNLLLGAVGGLAAGLALVLARRTLDHRVRNVKDVESALGGGVIGVIPKHEVLAEANRGVREDLGATAEAFRQLRTNLRFVDVDHPPRRIVFTSALASEGKSTVAGNLARLVAHAGQPVMYIDADLRRPTLADTWEIDAAIGLTQVLVGDVLPTDATVDSGIPNLTLLPAGRIPPNPSELLGSRRMQQLIDEFSRDHMVILDAPPLLPVTDAGLLAGFADGVIMVVASGKTNVEQSAQCRKILDQVGGRLLGIVLNMAPTKGINAYGAATGGYGGYGSRVEEETRKAYASPTDPIAPKSIGRRKKKVKADT